LALNSNKAGNMTHFDNVLKVYADQGLRSSEEWKSLGRDVPAGTGSRADADCRGRSISLFSRDQTQPLPPSRRLKA
jgi:hypothetical protein